MRPQERDYDTSSIETLSEHGIDNGIEKIERQFARAKINVTLSIQRLAERIRKDTRDNGLTQSIVRNKIKDVLNGLKKTAKNRGE